MTGGEHSDRNYGHDDRSYPSYYSQASQHEGYQEGAWAPGTRWAEQQGTPPSDGYRGDGSASGASYGQDVGAAATTGYPGYGGTAGAGAYRPYDHNDPSYGRGDASYQSGGAGYQSGERPYGVGDGGGDGWYGEDRAGGQARHLEQQVPDEGRRRGLPLWQELPLLLIIAFCLAILVRTFLLQAFYIPSGSMEDTLLAGDRVLVNKIVYQFREPARGEIVVFRAEAWSSQPGLDEDIGALGRIGRTLGDLIGISRPGEKDYIKRIIALPGDRVSCCDVDGRVFVNGQPLDEEYVLYDAPRGDSPEGTQDCRNRAFDEVVVEPGNMFVMGDHRAVSQDSRCQGQVLIGDIIGRADLIMWPSDRWTRLRAPDEFASVPTATPLTGDPARPAPVEPGLVLPMLLSLGVVRSVRARAVGGPAGGPATDRRTTGRRTTGIPPTAGT